MTKDKVFPKMPLKQQSGTGWQRNKVMLMPNSTLGWCTGKDKAFPKIPLKQQSGTGWQRNKVMLMPNSTLG